MSSCPEPVVNEESRMEQSCTTRLRLTLRYWDDVLTQLPESHRCLLGIVQVFFFFALAFCCLFTYLCGRRQDDLVLEVCGVMGLSVFPAFVILLPICLKLVYTLWFDLASLLLLIGIALRNIHGGVSNSFFAVGSIFMGLLVVATFLRCNICAPRNAAPPVPNLAVAYHAPRAGAEERVAE